MTGGEKCNEEVNRKLKKEKRRGLSGVDKPTQALLGDERRIEVKELTQGTWPIYQESQNIRLDV